MCGLAVLAGGSFLLKPGVLLLLLLLQAFNNGVLLVDKPKGWTSFDVCNAIKKPLKQLGVKKVSSSSSSSSSLQHHHTQASPVCLACAMSIHWLSCKHTPLVLHIWQAMVGFVLADL